MSNKVDVTMPVAVLFLQKIMHDSQLEDLIINHGSNTSIMINDCISDFLLGVVEILKSNKNLNIM